MDEHAKTDSLQSDTPASGLKIHGIVLASKEAIDAFIKEASKKTAAHTVSKQLSEVVNLVDLPKLKKGVWKTWLTAVKQLINITGSAAAFVDTSTLPEDMTPTLTVWRLWWHKALRDTDTSVTIPSDATPRQMLEIIIANNANKSMANSIEAARAFWEYAPGRIDLHVYLAEHVKRFNNLRSYRNMTPDVISHVRLLFIGHITIISAELGNRIQDKSYDDAINDCHKWVTSIKATDKKGSKKGNKTCNYCKKNGHLEVECHKKKKKEAAASSNSSNTRSTMVMAVGQGGDGYQLDTGADSHVAGSINNMSDYSSVPTTVHVAGGLTITSPGRGNLAMPSLGGSTEHLPGAILLPNERNLLSLRQLEKAGYSVNMPSQGPATVHRPDSSICAILQREDGALMWRPNSQLSDRRVKSVRIDNWHERLGHPGQQSLTKAL